MRVSGGPAVAASLAFSLDSQSNAIVTGADLTAEGWCFARGDATPPRVIGQVTLRSQTDVRGPGMDTAWELEASRTARPDVGAAYPGEPAAALSGFLWTFPVRPGYDASITITAEDEHRGSVVLAAWHCTVVGDTDQAAGARPGRLRAARRARGRRRLPDRRRSTSPW